MEANFDFIGQFDFEKLTVHQRALELYLLIRQIKFTGNYDDRIVARQLIRAGLSISLNIAEGSGRTSSKDRRNFFVISRGSTFECAAIMLAVQKQRLLTDAEFKTMYLVTLEIARMLSVMIKNLDKKIIDK